MSVLAVIVAACPPLALLLAVELLNGALERHQSTDSQSDSGDARSATVALPARDTDSGAETAEQRMWEHYERERACGRAPTGAELDRIAGTNNYGRKVLRRWQDAEVSGAFVDD